MSTQLVITALILALTVIIPCIVGLVALSVPMFVPETPETGSVEDMTPISINLGSRIPLNTVLPLQDMLALYVADLKSEAEAVFTPNMTPKQLIQSYMGLAN